ncbi:FixH family protein [Kordiimonas aquimaris]|uniref:FixH family protein n=1 Tax=Kordiimonas aquimaris TaxID=707591 RepID=UPI0021D34867|nr:FixH family protein [Kordiimonas aquimaris]
MVQLNQVTRDEKTTGMRDSDKWIPWYFVAFFVVLAILDGVFVYIASSTHTGVVTENAYNEGLRYNQTIAAAEAQDRLGWGANVSYESDTLSVALVDDNDTAIQGAVVEALFVRPTQDGGDFRISVAEQSPGIYEKPVSVPMGQWDVRIYVTWKQKQFQSAKRIVVRPN